MEGIEPPNITLPNSMPYSPKTRLAIKTLDHTIYMLEDAEEDTMVDGLEEMEEYMQKGEFWRKRLSR